ncbi:MAG TPA: MotA/TolQ/ExbB proton channel family protein [Bacteroidia bacterium]|nr:MotA/TolQ/ExbB proton channel family protein [Bacteroidia bacterium]
MGLRSSPGPVWGLLGTVVGMIRAFDAIAEDSAATPETLSQDIRFALVASAVGTAAGLVGAILVLTAFFAAKNREHWFFWWSVVLSAFWCFSSPIVGLPILILFLWRRAEFMKPATQ